MRSRPGKVRLKTPPDVLRAAHVLLPDAPPRHRVDLPTLFGNRRPVEVEIGPGKGAFLLARARHRPEINFLAIDWVARHAAYVADRAYRAGLSNVRALCADAADLFSTGLTNRSAWRVHIYFPDPWPKRRHWRRRLIQPAFAANLRRVLRLGGIAAVASDDAPYFRRIRWILSAVPGLVEVPFAQVAPGLLVGSNFEIKRLRVGAAARGMALMRYR